MHLLSRQKLLVRVKGLLLIPAFAFSGVMYSQSNESEIKSDTLQGRDLADVVVTGSRMRESLLRSPVGVQKAGKAYFQNSSADWKT
jgi:hypothetical protein